MSRARIGPYAALTGTGALCLLTAGVALPGCAAESNLPPPPPHVAPLPVNDGGVGEKLPSSASGLYARACDGGSAAGCNNLGLRLLEGRDGEKADPKGAEALFQRACDLGDATACGNLGFLLRTRDPARAIGVLTRACDRSVWFACYWLSDIYSEGDYEDLPLAFSVAVRGCKAGNELSCGNEAIFYWLGHGTAKDEDKASRLFDKACKAGVAFACTGLANLLLASSSSAQSVERIRAAYEAGCVDSFPAGCYMFGLACGSGKLGSDYVPRAEPLLRRACQKGHADACTALAKHIEEESGGDSPR